MHLFIRQENLDTQTGTHRLVLTAIQEVMMEGKEVTEVTTKQTGFLLYILKATGRAVGRMREIIFQ